MKKILIATALIAAFSSSLALAKTEGEVIGIDLIRSSAQVKSNSDSADDAGLTEYYSHKKKDSGYSVGVNYKYAFNFNDFFIAPGLSYNFINNEAKVGYSKSSDDFYSQSVKLNNQISFQTNLGYDVSDKFAVYVPVGVSSFGYEIKTSDVSVSSVTTKKTGRESSIFYGLGLSYQPAKNWVMNLEYNKFQDLKLTSANAATINGGAIKANVGVNMVKLGVAYRF